MSHAADDVVSGDPLAVMVLEYLVDPEIELRPDDPEAECRLNTWHYSLPIGFDPTAVAAALEHVVLQLSKRHHARPSTFYCWFDEQAGQFRCSLTSKPADELPFAGRYKSTSDITDVLPVAASAAQPGIIPWDELAEGRGSAEVSQRTPDPFPVWTAPLL